MSISRERNVLPYNGWQQNELFKLDESKNKEESPSRPPRNRRLGHKAAAARLVTTLLVAVSSYCELKRGVVASSPPMQVSALSSGHHEIGVNWGGKELVGSEKEKVQSVLTKKTTASEVARQVELSSLSFRPDGFNYTIQPGDTLRNISRQFGVEIGELVSINNLSNPNLLRAVEQLFVPFRFPLYLPAADESASYVAEKFGISLDNLKKINPGIGDLVSADQGVYLPVLPQQIDRLGSITVRDFGISGFSVTAKEVRAFLLQRGWEPVPLVVDLVPTFGSLRNPVAKGWSFRQDPERHYIVVYCSDTPNQVRYLLHELCHEALNSSDELLVWRCTLEAEGDGGLEGINYTVQSGDTLWKISRQFGVEVKQLMTVNGIKNPNLIRVGQVIRIPQYP